MKSILLGLVVVSALYWLWALGCVLAFRRWRSRRPEYCPPVTVLKPLYGADHHLYENLRSFCEQDYPAYQVIFGVRDSTDPAIAVANRVIREFPELDLSLVVSDEIIGSNFKVSNLWNLCARAKHDVIVLADSDMRVRPEYLRTIVAPLADKKVGPVTCLYKGVPAGGIWSALGAMFINEWFFPSALVAVTLQGFRNVFGATIAFRRDMLEEIGGFEAIADYLADDYMLGWLATRRGFRIVLSPYVVENIVVERGFRALFLHELRWARTLRTASPVGYFFSVLTHGLPISFLCLVWGAFWEAALAALLSYVALRLAIRVVVCRALRLPGWWRDAWLIPLRDTFTFAFWALSFLGRRVQWKGQRFVVFPDGRLCPVTGRAEAAPGPVMPADSIARMEWRSYKGREKT